MIYNATLESDGETFLFSSLDGKDWLPVNRHGVTGQDEEGLAKIFEGDGNMRPLRFTRTYLEGQGATFEEES